MSGEFRCPHCGREPAAENEDPFTYFEFVPRWQHVRREGGRLVVSERASFGDDGDQAFLLCNGCDRPIDDLPPHVFEGQDSTTPFASVEECS